jgi:CHASE2 domain-containing sensor protein
MNCSHYRKWYPERYKIVLVGATIDELHDKFSTPYGGEWTSG